MYCTTPDNEQVGTCGGQGTLCDDGCSGYVSLIQVRAWRLTCVFLCRGNALCHSGNCDINAGVCIGTTVNVGVSQLPRARRAVPLVAREFRCPATHSACAIDTGRSFECIDTQVSKTSQLQRLQHLMKKAVKLGTVWRLRRRWPGLHCIARRGRRGLRRWAM